MNCADCNGPIGQDNGPPDGWQLEDGRTVCHACCSVDTGRVFEQMRQLHRWLTELESGCKICGNTPDEIGMIEHGRGCFAVSEDGGGISFAT